MSHPRGLSEEEATAWERLAATVRPLHPARPKAKPAKALQPTPKAALAPPAMPSAPLRVRPAAPVRQPSPPAPQPSAPAGLDSHWERRLRSGTLAPDFTLDLHEHSLDAAYQRLLGGLDLAREQGARVVLVIAGRERPVASADRAERRGAIRAKLLDWLAASRHSSAIAAIRKAHRRHGGEGALYVILKKPR
ncbi:DNA mismatch repair protein MutS [Porphyrobacter algicida]|uniref:DNA mismatch repair protein MutS n=1 Tax=Qipengyuania algicida TaxID=1836209 RepID=A0A845AH05_9SPHN|nr:Smr/MutS family protein [Qipengyuania algicida]MXP29520.1 DNA mismatch repair protein MutS [Qipengyuania algicida]